MFINTKYRFPELCSPELCSRNFAPRNFEPRNFAPRNFAPTELCTPELCPPELCSPEHCSHGTLHPGILNPGTLLPKCELFCFIAQAYMVISADVTSAFVCIQLCIGKNQFTHFLNKQNSSLNMRNIFLYNVDKNNGTRDVRLRRSYIPGRALPMDVEISPIYYGSRKAHPHTQQRPPGSTLVNSLQPNKQFLN